MYLGIKTTKHWTCLTYNTAFCFRRILLVLIYASFVLFQCDTFYLIKGFLAVQSAYLCYIMETTPHQDIAFVYLDVINEFCLITLIYIGFSSTTAAIVSTPTTQYKVCYLAIIISSFIIIANLTAMLQQGIRSLFIYFKIKKAKNKEKVSLLVHENLCQSQSE